MGMQPSYLDAWIVLLRSGELKQAQGLLQDIDEDGYAENAYCCLGVYDRAQGMDYEKESFVKDDVECSRTKVDSGLTGTCQDMLAHINDHWKGFGFPEIADLLEAERESLTTIGDFPNDWYADQWDHVPHSVMMDRRPRLIDGVPLPLPIIEPSVLR